MLITLGIIGIVAAMTLPSILNNSRNKQLEAAFKKQYSVISNIINKMYAEGICTTSDCINLQEIYSFFQEEAKVIRICNPRGDYKSLCFTWHSDSYYKSFMKKNNLIVTDNFDDLQLILSDGALIGFNKYNGIVNIGVDVNGKKKGPNVFGYDLFLFKIEDKVDRGVLSPASGDCNSTGRDSVYNGQGCASRALSELNYFKNLP